MSKQPIATEDTPEEPTAAPGLSLPDWLAQLIDPRVMAEHQKKVQNRVNNGLEDAVLRRRCASVVASYLLKEYGDD